MTAVCRRPQLTEYFVSGTLLVERAEASSWLLLLLLLPVGVQIAKHVHSSLLVGYVQQTSNPVDGDRRRAASKSGTARQHRAVATAPSFRVHPVDLLVVQVGDEHVTGSAIDGNGARKKRALVGAAGRWTPAPFYCSSVSSKTSHLSPATTHELIRVMYSEII